MTTAVAAYPLVEFAGLPGAGKTVLADSTCQALQAAGVPSWVSDDGISASVPVPIRAGRRLALAGVELSRHPVRGARQIQAIHQIAPASARDALAGVVQWFAVQRLEARANLTPGVHLLQEGPIQTVWTLALRSRGRPEELLGHLPRPRAAALRADGLPRLLVLVDAPLEVVSARLSARTSRHSRTQRLSERERTAELVVGQALMREIVASSECRRMCLVNDGTSTPEELGSRIAEWVLRAGA